MQPEVLAVVKRSPLGESLGPERMFSSIDTAVTKFRAQYGGERPAPGESHA
jgi:hypothetical protein